MFVSLFDGQAKRRRLCHIAGVACYCDRVGPLGGAVVRGDDGDDGGRGMAAATTTANRKYRRAQDQQGQNGRCLAALPGNHECYSDQSKAGERQPSSVENSGMCNRGRR